MNNPSLHPVIARLPFLHMRWIRTAIIAATIALIYLPAGFFPISMVPHFENHAQLTSGELSLIQRGIAVSTPQPEWFERLLDQEDFELTLEIRPKTSAQMHAVIFSLSVDQTRQDFLISQVEHRLHLRIRAPEAAPHGRRHIYLPRILARNEWQRIAIRIQRAALTVSINGKEAWSETLPGVPFGVWSKRDTLSLGNSLEFNHAWLGMIRKATIKIGSEVINILDGTTVQTPLSYQFIRADRLERFFMPAFGKIDGSTLKDWLLNFLGFIPFGILITTLTRPRRVYTTATISALLLSLSIEMTQMWLPWRVPSSHDLALNTLGGFVGAWVATRLGQFLAKRHTHADSSDPPPPKIDPDPGRP